MHLYAIHRENHDDQSEVLYFTDRTTALDCLIRTHVENDFHLVTCMYVFHQDDIKLPMKLVEYIEPLWNYYDGYAMITTMKKHDFTKQMVLDNPKLLYADLKTTFT